MAYLFTKKIVILPGWTGNAEASDAHNLRFNHLIYLTSRVDSHIISYLARLRMAKTLMPIALTI